LDQRERSITNYVSSGGGRSPTSLGYVKKKRGMTYFRNAAD